MEKQLLQACREGSLQLVRQLVEEKEIDVNTVLDWSGWTPLHHACRQAIIIITNDHTYMQLTHERSNSINIKLVIRIRSRPMLHTPYDG